MYLQVMRRFRLEPPGWLPITLMTLALGVAVWAVAQDQVAELWPL